MIAIKDIRFKPFALVFYAAMILLPLVLFLLPKQNYNALERRVLAETPAFTTQSGQFSNAMESYLNDHFPLRNTWLRLDAQRRLVSGQNLLDPVWVMKDGSLAEAPVRLEGSRLRDNLGRLKTFAQTGDQPFYMLVPPSKGALSSREAYTAYPDEAAALQITAELSPDITVIPLFDTFKQEGLSLYFATDPHWNHLGALKAYRQVSGYLGFIPLSQDHFQAVESPGFYGTEYSRAALWERPADTLVTLDPGLPLTVSMQGQEKPVDSLFFRKYLETADKYPVFLDGNHGLTVIDNLALPDGPRLFVLKDSFGNSLIPLLVPHYSRITAVDLRAYRGKVVDLPGYQEADAILAVYSLSILAENTNFAFLK